MRVSVVTPSFNLGYYLEDTVRSVIANLRPDDEYFIIDGGSTDNSVDVIRQYESSITSWVSEHDAGYADALAKGFARATGDILCWINAGDLYLSGALDIARQMLTADVDFVFGDDLYIDEKNRVLSYSNGWVPDLLTATLFGGWSPLQDACFWRRSLYERAGGMNPKLQYAADYDLFLRMSLVGRTRYVPVTFSAFRRHVGQKSVSGSSAYDVERKQVRARELREYKEYGELQKKLRGGMFRLAMSARSRLAPLVWRRPGVVGKQVLDLSCASDWHRADRSCTNVG
ncbi:glycosyltransferase family 2 protein [Bradyrhizobium symbiodeficiens]|uniref:glycosyltransferase family 2 protein n=1 Tax=Bradyrhizobium symbiodeficiens TaxID=1404367 RepID=UPI00140FFAF5|nr:glycosyltransferase family 2 protein [Bradyrhizobium symbiodeficiens]QIP01735.1 glycosyltransferase [Bradyrhizobium symbiodeficiens]